MQKIWCKVLGIHYDIHFSIIRRSFLLLSAFECITDEFLFNTGILLINNLILCIYHCKAEIHATINIQYRMVALEGHLNTDVKFHGKFPKVAKFYVKFHVCDFAPGREIWRKISCLRLHPMAQKGHQRLKYWRKFYMKKKFTTFPQVAKFDVKFHVCDFSPVAKFDVKFHVCDFPRSQNLPWIFSQ